MFMTIVREMQIEPNSYYLETVINQSLVNNFALNCNRPKVTTVEQNAPKEDKTNRHSQSLCPSNWSDYLHIEDDTDDENLNQAEPLTDNSQPSTSTGTCIPQDLNTDIKV